MKWMLMLALVWMGPAMRSVLAGAPDRTDGPLTWNAITTVLANQPATGPERDLSLDSLGDRMASLPMEFVREEQDAAGRPRFLYAYADGSFRFSCYVEGAAAGAGSGTMAGRITRLRYTHTDLRGTRSYFLWLNTDTLIPSAKP
jgi:hypothetical protein